MRTILQVLCVAGLLMPAGKSLADDRVGAAALSLPLSVRQMGMGHIGVGGAGVLGAWTNPALLANQESRGEAAIGGASMFEGQQTTGGLGAGWMLNKKWGVGVLATYYSLSTPEIDAYGDEIAVDLGQQLVSAGATTAMDFGKFRAGLTLKMVSETVVEEQSAGFAADLGVAGELEDLSAGISFRNVGPALDESGEAALAVAEVLPTEIRLGAAYKINPYGVVVAANYVMPSKLDATAGMGAEWWPSRFLGVRAGVMGLGGKDDLCIAAGLSGLYKKLGVDYALNTHPLGTANRVSLSYMFGGDTAQIVARAPRPKPEPEPEPVKEEPVPEPVEEAAEKPAGLLNVAVANLEARNVSSGDAAVIGDLLRDELVKSGGFNVVEKQAMDQILAEQAFQQTGCTTEDCAIKLGKLLNVHRILVGSFGKLMDKHFLSVRVINVETGKIMFSDRAGGRSVEDMEKGVRALAKGIAKRLR